MFRCDMAASVMKRGRVCWKVVRQEDARGPYWSGFECVGPWYVAASRPPTERNQIGWYVFETKRAARNWANSFEDYSRCRAVVIPVRIRGRVVSGGDIAGRGYRAEFIRRLRKDELVR